MTYNPFLLPRRGGGCVHVSVRKTEVTNHMIDVTV